MSRDPSRFNTRKAACLSAAAGILFLIVGIFGQGWDWRRILPLLSGILWLIIAARQLRNS